MSDKKNSNNSNSDVQQEKEREILQILGKDTSINFDYNPDEKYEIEGLNVKPDAMDKKNKVVVEVYAHIGALKPAQYNKIKADILKLALIGTKLKSWTKIMCVVSDEAKNYCEGKSWLAKAVEEFCIKIVKIDLEQESVEEIKQAQKLQSNHENQ